MEYWIIIDGKAQGPYGVADMIRRGITPSTPVWRQGMTEWVPAGSVRDLAGYFSVNEAYHSQQLDYSTPPPSPVTPAPRQSCGSSEWHTPDSNDDRPPMPSTYLGWNIAATVLCCLPTGIIGIIYSSMARNWYDQGDYAGARDASKWASVWLILSMVFGLIQGVFVVVTNLLSFLWAAGLD